MTISIDAERSGAECSPRLYCDIVSPNHLNHPQSIFSHYLPSQVIACTSSTSIATPHQPCAPQQKYAFIGSGGGWNHQRFCSEITTLSLSSSQWWPIALSKVASKIIGKNNFYHKERAKAGLKWAKESKNFLCEVSMTKCDGAVLVSPCNAEWSHPND